MFLKLVTYVIVGLAILLLAGFEVLDVEGRMDILEKKHPRIWAVASKRPLRFLLLFLCAGFLAKDVKDATEIAEPPRVRLSPPVISVRSTAVAPSDAKEPKNSLRRRTLRLADEIDAYGKERGEARMTVSTMRDSTGQIPALNQYDSETITMYVSRGMKERTLGIVRELRAKGLDTGYLENSAEQRPLTVYGFGGWSELAQLRELAYHLDANGNVVRIDY